MFLADAMLGRLARWLRVIGSDTMQLPVDTPDRAIVARANGDHRVLLTRDRHLLRELRPRQALEIKSDAPLTQLREVIEACGLRRPPELLLRCLLCNTLLRDVPVEEATARLPEAARGLPGPVRICPTCNRVYWRGSHVRRMEAALSAALPDWR